MTGPAGRSSLVNVPVSTTVTLDDGERTTVLEAPGPIGAPTVVLLHGFSATAGLNFPGAFDALSRRFRVLGIDHRGHGQGLRARQPFTLEQAGTDVLRVADRIGADELILVGYSMGGPVALHAAREDPNRVVGLVACATAACFDTPDLAATRFGPMLGRLRSMPLRTRRGVSRLMLRHLIDNGRVNAEYADVLRGHDPAALWEAVQALGRFDARPWAGELGVPAVSIIPDRDGVVPVARQRELARLLDSSIITVSGEHRVAATDPATFLPALTTACERIRTRARL